MADAVDSAVADLASKVIVTLAHCTAPGQVLETRLELPTGTTVQGALLAAGLAEATQPELKVGIWGKACALTHRLQDGDRVEIYRPLVVDPKVARRERFARQGSRGAGLFAHNRKT